MDEDTAKGGNLEIITPQGLQNVKEKHKGVFSKKVHCDRCGNCCRKGTPSLMKKDLHLFLSGILSHENTYTIRLNEPLISYDDNEKFESFVEIIKIKSKHGAECFFYDYDKGCVIYENRPLQCKAYNCWEISELIVGLEQNGLDRGDIFGSAKVVLDIINKHEEKCSYEKLSQAFERVASGSEDAVEDILDMLQYDTYIRPFLEDRLNIPRESLDLMLGRPLIETITGYGFKVIKDGEDYILLPIESDS